MDVLWVLIGYRTSIWMFYGFSLATELLYVLRDLIGCYIFYRCFTSSHWLQHLVITLAQFCRHFKIEYLFLGATFFSTYLCPFLDVCDFYLVQVPATKEKRELNFIYIVHSN